MKAGFDAAVIAEIESFVGPGAVEGLDLEAIETAARRRALGVAARAVEQRLDADRSDHAGPSLPCPCGKPARYAGRRAKTFTTALGEMTLSRAYYHCGACGAGSCPRDRALGIEDTSLSPATTRMVGLTGAMVSFAEGSELLAQLAGVSVDAKQVERTAEAHRTRDRPGRARCRRARAVAGRHAVPGHGRHRHPDARGRTGRTCRQAARRHRPDARGQARHGLDRRGP